MDVSVCVFKVAVVSANNVWCVHGKDSAIGKAAVSIHFPGLDDGSRYQSDAVSPLDVGGVPSDLACANRRDEFGDVADGIDSIAGDTRSDTSSGQGRKGSKAQERNGKLEEQSKEQESSAATYPRPVSFAFGAVAEFTRTSDWLLWHNLVSDPLVISLLWMPPRGQRLSVVGTVKLDLSGLLFACMNLLEQECAINPANPPEFIESRIPSSEGKKDGAQKVPAKAKKGNSSEEVPPTILEGATLKLQVSTDVSILSDIDRQKGVILEFDKFSVEPVPPQILESATMDSISTFALAFQIPGFSGPWWDSLSAVRQEAKDSFAIARMYGGVLAFVPSHLEVAFAGESRKTEPSIEGVSQLSPEANAVMTQPGSLTVTAGPNPTPVETRIPCCPDGQKAVIAWGTSIKRFLPSEAVNVLKESISRKCNWPGEFARYSESQQGIFDPSFARDHKIMHLDFSSLIEEDVCEVTICSPLENFCKRLLQNCENLDDYSKARPAYADDALQLTSELTFHVKTSRPLEPVWVAPPLPEMKITDVLAVRPKLTKITDEFEAELEEFQKLINVGAQAIFSLQQKIISEDYHQHSQHIYAWNDRQLYPRIFLLDIKITNRTLSNAEVRKLYFTSLGISKQTNSFAKLELVGQH